MRTIKLLVAILISVALSACGGGDSSSPPAPAPTYSISGTVTQSVGGAAVSGATITLSGTSAATTTTAADGTYSFAGLANGSYTVTPSLAGNAFSPASSAVTVSGANVTGKNFTATAAATTYSISGAVSGAATSGVTITLSGANSGSVVTGAGGTYTFSGLVAGNYTVTPSLAGYTFAPTSIAITGLAANSTGNNFVATAIPVAHSISGNVSGTTGVTITVTGTASASATTDGSGNYTVPGLYDGSYTVTPSKTGYTFNPVSTPVTMSGANVTGTDFVGTANSAVLASASGTLTGAWIEGVTVTVSGGASGTTTTNASGNYSFTNLPSGQSYTFTPTLTGYTYAAASQTVAIPAGSSTAVVVPNMVASSAISSYSISGTVSYPAGTQTGGILIQAYLQGCTGCNAAAGTAIAAPGAYTIRGLQNGSYYVIAERDGQGTGQDNANNPISTPLAATVAFANVTAINPVLADPATPAPVTPTGLSVAPGSGVAFIQYTPPENANGQEIATSYQLTWGTTATATGSGSANFAAQGSNNSLYVLSGLPNGTAYYFKMAACVGGTTACVGGTQSAATAAVGPVTIDATIGPNTVSGTATFTGAATGPLYVVIHNNAGAIYLTRIASPTSGVGYSIAGVPAGDYAVFAIVDQNNNGLIDAGDITNNDVGDGGGPAISVTGATTANLTLSSANAIAEIGTDHQFDGTNHNYSVNSFVRNLVKHVVAATLFSGPNVAVPLDMGTGGNEFQSYNGIGATVPVVGDTYRFKITYSDGTSGIMTASVTGVLSSFAQALTVIDPTAAAPTFSWTAPASPPASYLYTLGVWGSGGFWYYPQDSNGMPSTQTSVVYNVDGSAPPLGAGTNTWQVQVKDANSPNRATRQATFTH